MEGKLPRSYPSQLYFHIIQDSSHLTYTYTLAYFMKMCEERVPNHQQTCNRQCSATTSLQNWRNTVKHYSHVIQLRLHPETCDLQLLTCHLVVIEAGMETTLRLMFEDACNNVEYVTSASGLGIWGLLQYCPDITGTASPSRFPLSQLPVRCSIPSCCPLSLCQRRQQQGVKV